MNVRFQKGGSLTVPPEEANSELAQLDITGTVYSGTIHIREGDRITVNLVVAGKLPEIIDEATFTTINSRGKLFRLLLNGRHSVGARITTATYVCFNAVFASVTTQDPVPTSISVVRLTFDQLESWHPPLVTDSKVEEERYIVAPLPDIKESYDFANDRLYFHSVCRFEESSRSVRIWQDDFITLEFGRPTTAVDLGFAIRSLQHLFDFVYGNPVQFKTIEALVPNPSGDQLPNIAWRIFASLHKRTNSSDLVNSMNMIVVHKLQQRFSDLVSAWAAFWEEFADPIAVLYNSYYSDGFVDSHFMSSISFVDSYCKRFRGPVKPLEANVIELLNEFKEELGYYVKSPLSELAQRMVKTRNALAHLDTRYSEYVDRSISSLAACAFLLSECLIANHLNLPKEIRKDIISARIARYKFDI